jgi:hypothetical protein
MDLGMMIKAIPPTFWGIVVGSLFTMLGVVLTNAGNTRRLRIQHEHERELESREQDLSLRRDVYLAAMEAISAGMVAVGRFGEMTTPYPELMKSYSDRAPAMAKVPIVGREETIEAVANFSQGLTAAFLRLSSRREQLNALWHQNAAVEEKLEIVTKEQDRVYALIEERRAGGTQDETELGSLQRIYEAKQRRIEELRAEQAEVESKLYPAQMALVRKGVEETAELDRLITPVISAMRGELELPIDETFYNRLVESSHQKLQAYLEAFAGDVAPLFEGYSIEEKV